MPGNKPAISYVPTVVQRAFSAHMGDRAQQEAAVRVGPAWDYGIKVGNIVVAPVAQVERANWSAAVRENLHVEHVNIAKSVRASDGRLVVAAWKATEFAPGTLTDRADQVILAALRLDDALAEIPVPDFFPTHVGQCRVESDFFDLADLAAWVEEPGTILDAGLNVRAQADESQRVALSLAAQAIDRLTPIDAPDQVTHADMFATTILSWGADPTVTDIVPAKHPRGYTAALAIVDSLIAGATTVHVVDRFAGVENITQLVYRALLYRLYVHALHPLSRSNSRSSIVRVARELL